MERYKAISYSSEVVYGDEIERADLFTTYLISRKEGEVRKTRIYESTISKVDEECFGRVKEGFYDHRDTR